MFSLGFCDHGQISNNQSYRSSPRERVRCGMICGVACGMWYVCSVWYEVRDSIVRCAATCLSHWVVHIVRGCLPCFMRCITYSTEIIIMRHISMKTSREFCLYVTEYHM